VSKPYLLNAYTQDYVWILNWYTEQIEASLVKVQEALFKASV
jgi:hypothetical protein